ncbi:hypothetical protein F4820DRAFT_282605 [Hypoxylon rubiginosum]|uniref:Uncharacterized protein n=1 Tax=Hypoxylon rubiginosum TaxID=110542 RepID=A0ACB9Z1T8_9PEZI|nr:hypothetical protein F4820DRAFT_282605 [Hypoxylon rubiginosum]
MHSHSYIRTFVFCIVVSLPPKLLLFCSSSGTTVIWICGANIHRSCRIGHLDAAPIESRRDGSFVLQPARKISSG